MMEDKDRFNKLLDIFFTRESKLEKDEYLLRFVLVEIFEYYQSSSKSLSDLFETRVWLGR